MGCLLTDQGCRFRVWAPNAQSLQVVIGTVGNFGSELKAISGQIWINLPSWAVLVFVRE